MTMSAIDKELLIKAMEKSGVTQKQLAESIGKSKQYVSDLTTGHRTLKRNPALRKAIASALDVPVHWIERPAPEKPVAA